VSRSYTSMALGFCLLLFITAVAPRQAAGQQAEKPAPPPTDEWTDDFSGPDLNPVNWERFTFEGGNGGTVKLDQGELRMRSVSGARAGVRSKPTFSGDHFLIEGTIAKVGPTLSEPGQTGEVPGNGILTVLFDSSGRNRVEWLLTSEGLLEAWAMTDGRAERLDGRNLATKAKNPTLAIVRRGDEFLFMLNGQEGLRKNLKNMPRSFHVMLYGFGSSENNWDSVRVVTVKQSK
jgi:hypothetical protein